MNFNGKGVPKNLDESYHWFREAAKSGNENARKALKSSRALKEIKMNVTFNSKDFILNCNSQTKIF